MTDAVVVVGAGQAGFQTALSLRERRFEGPVVLIGAEDVAPYQRPPLSKAYLVDDPPREEDVILRPEAFYQDKDIEVRRGRRAVALDRAARTVTLDDGTSVSYGHLVLATGTRPLTLAVPGAELAGVFALRTLADARRLRSRLRPGARLVVVGGGFVGMEVAAAAAGAGMHVTVLEAADRILARVVAPEIGGHLHDTHRDRGVDVRTGVTVAGLVGEGGVVTAVRPADGPVLPADTVVVGVGVRPEVELAREAGLAAHGTRGVLVDEQLRTGDPHISAIGDCASFPSVHAEAEVRLESVQNAVDHARHVAARVCGADPGPYRAVPWFWTHQYDRNVQIAGIGGPADERVVLGDPGTGRFSVARFRGGRLVAVESVNSPADHMAARRLLDRGHGPSPAEAGSPGFTLKEFVRTAARPEKIEIRSAAPADR